MNNIKILKNKTNSHKQNLIRIFLIIFLIISSFISFKVFAIGKNLLNISSSKNSLLGQLNNFANPNKKLKGEKEKRTNILLLGAGGENHEGTMLTDTIIIFSINYEEDSPRIALISIPRDLYVNLKDFGNTKINSIYAIDKENGLDESRAIQAISNISGLPIHYFVRVDFEGFVKAIDALGGIEVNIEHSFVDEKYPTDNFGYQTISFEKGLNHMNGATALKFSRSRYGIVTDNSGAFEANDAARAKRQQQILYASKEKFLSLGTIINPSKINQLLNILGNHVKTDLELLEIINLANLARNISSADVNNYVLDDSPNGLLYASQSPDGSFIFLPKTNNFQEIHYFCKNIFEQKSQNIETANIEIFNGTKIPNLASEAASFLSYENINITNIDNAPKTSYNQSILYDLTNNKPKTIKFLKSKFNAKIIKTNKTPKEFNNNNQSEIILIIGKNFQELPHYDEH